MPPITDYVLLLRGSVCPIQWGLGVQLDEDAIAIQVPHLRVCVL